MMGREMRWKGYCRDGNYEERKGEVWRRGEWKGEERNRGGEKEKEKKGEERTGEERRGEEWKPALPIPPRLAD